MIKAEMRRLKGMTLEAAAEYDRSAESNLDD
jgi:hypothetical protein